MKKLLSKSFVLALVMLLVMAVLSFPGETRSNAQVEGKGFSIVSMQPDVVQALRSQGKKVNYPFPNTANKGKKFNPVGETIGQLVTASEQNVLVIFANFTTPPPGGPATRLDLGTYFDSMLFGTTYNPPEYAAGGYSGYPTDRTLYNYYKEVSYGYIEIDTQNKPSDMDWMNVGHPYDYYTKADGIHDNGFGYYPQNVQGIVLDAVRAADPYVDFSIYAVNGEVPNLFVVYAGTGAEWSGDPSLIWSHSWDLKEGSGLTDADLTFDGVKINSYAMMPEVGGDMTGYYIPSGPFPPTVGVFAHEYGHVLGLPDQYDYGYESDGTDVYSLMAGGSWNRYPRYQIFSGNSPAHMDAWSKYRLGFLTPVEITSTTDVTLPPAETNPVAYKMVVPNSGGKEYFLFENRQAIGFDQGLQRFGTHGLAIYHVDDTVFTRNYWRPNEAENWKEFRSEGWQKAWTGETHYGISIIQADDQWHLEHAAFYWIVSNVSSSLSGDLYPGMYGVTSFSSYTKPNSSNYYFWAGSDPKYGYSGVTVTNIAETAGNITANMSFVPWSPKKK